jgi:hypothetical protein
MSIEERFYSEAFENGVNYAIQRMFNSVEKLDPEKFSGKESWEKWVNKKRDLAAVKDLRLHKQRYDEEAAAKKRPAESSRPTPEQIRKEKLEKAKSYIEEAKSSFKASDIDKTPIEAKKKALVPVEMKAPTSKYKSTTFRTAEKLAKVPGESVRVAGKILKRFLGR